VTTLNDATPLIRALRASHDRLAGLVAGLDADGLRGPSYDKEWSVADVLSHLGSGAEIMSLSVDAGVSGAEPPEPAAFQAIWDTWNARTPEEQAARSIEANEALLSRVESLSPQQRDAFSVTLFGPVPFDLAGVLGLRLSEHAVHTWDVAVALDPAARVAPDAVDLLIDQIQPMVAFLGKKAPAPVVVAVTTTSPDCLLILDTGGVTLTAEVADAPAAATLAAPAEAFLRLVYGRLDDPAELRASGVTVPELKSVFAGF
jgi:uncharacterized protein (TIGR03083 family)